MRLSLPAWSVCAFVMMISAWARADEGPSSVFTQALSNGSASAPLSDDGNFGKAVVAIKKRTGDNGPVAVYAQRITRFTQQPLCGRVGFIIGQPSAKVMYSDMSGQFNICEDGEPPLRMCKGHPDKLVPYNSVCADASTPIDTPEVAAAIQGAVTAGGMTPEQAAKAVRSATTDAPTAKGSGE